MKISSSVKWWDLPLLWLSDSQKLWEICITTEIVSNVIHRWKKKCYPWENVFLNRQRVKLLSLTIHSFMSAKERQKICESSKWLHNQILDFLVGWPITKEVKEATVWFAISKALKCYLISLTTDEEQGIRASDHTS